MPERLVNNRIAWGKFFYGDNMNETEKYFLQLVKDGKVIVDPDTGDVYSFLHGKARKVSAINSAGYRHMSSGPSREKRYYITAHRLIWIAANGEIHKGSEINHINGNKLDNRLCNLELVTRSQNVNHAHHVLGKKFGVWSLDYHPASYTTTPEQTSEINRLIMSGEKNKSKIARKTGVSRGVVLKAFKRLKEFFNS